MASKEMDALADEAVGDGIEKFNDVRAEMIRVRNEALNTADFDRAVFSSHVIWWLSALAEQVDP